MFLRANREKMRPKIPFPPLQYLHSVLERGRLKYTRNKALPLLFRRERGKVSNGRVIMHVTEKSGKAQQPHFLFFEGRE